MKKYWLFLSILSLITIGFGKEYLVKIETPTPNYVSQLLDAKVKIVAEMNGFALATVSDDELEKIESYRYQILDQEPSTKDYFLIIALDKRELKTISEMVQPLVFDGENFLIRMTKEIDQKLANFRIERKHLTLKPIVKSEGIIHYPRPFQNPLIEDMVSQVNQDSAVGLVRRLQNFHTRYSTTDSCFAAAEWVKNKFLEYGCDTAYLENYLTGYAPNVIGIKRGVAHPDNIYVVIDGHMDCTSNQAPNFCPGADDNASGTAAAIEAARVMNDYDFEYSIRYIAFTGEEQGLYGSEAYATAARNRGDSIFGVINYDMIGYADGLPEDLEVIGKTSNPNCQAFVDYFVACANLYTNVTTSIHMVPSMGSSDHSSFWDQGYVAFCGIEDYMPTNPHYHQTSDSIGAGFNAPDFFTEVTKAGVACLASLANPILPNQPYVAYRYYRLDDSTTGNNNGRWDAGEEVHLYTVLRNLGTVGATNVSADLSSSDPYVEILQGHADFGNIGPLDSAINTSPYRVSSLITTPRGHNANFDLTVQSSETTWVYNLSIQIGQFMSTDPIPDGPREPALYWAYDNTDTTYSYHPQYDWVEINTIGTRLSFANNDQVNLVNLPASFGPLKYYGSRYTQISVSADGWIAAGFDTIRQYRNTSIPSSEGPAAFVALNFDDLYPNNSGSGGIYYYHDEAQHRFIIEYDSVPYYDPRSAMDKFELIIYDTTIAAQTPDNILIAQYQTANNYSNSTFGIEDPTETIGIQYAYNGTYHPGAAPLIPGRAIEYCTNSPITNIGDFKISQRSTMNPKLEIYPNPFKVKTVISYSLPTASQGTLKIYDVKGSLVKTFASSRHPSLAVNSVLWDGKDNQGKKVLPGVYFFRLDNGPGSITEKAIMIK
jgi:hypothetical protein